MKFEINYDLKSLNKPPKPQTAPPGCYESTLVEISPAPGYVEGSAFVFRYKLTDPNTGAQYEKSETLINDVNNPRFGVIIKNLTNQGISVQNTDDLIGMREQIDLKYVAVNGKKYTNIISRTFIDFEL